MRAPRRALLTLDEVALELGVSRRTIERRIAAGELERVNDGPRIARVRREALDDYIATKARAAAC